MTTRAEALEAARRELITFLLGEGPLEGYWFGEHRPSGKTWPANYWWRKHVRALLSTEQEGGGELEVPPLRSGADLGGRNMEELRADLREANEAILELQQAACNRDGVPMPSQRSAVDRLQEAIRRARAIIQNARALGIHSQWADEIDAALSQSRTPAKEAIDG